MKRIISLATLFVAICMISTFCVSCGKKSDGDTSGNAQNGVISNDNTDKSEGGFVSEVISKGEEVVSKAEDVISGVISDIMPDDSSNDSSDDSEISESPSDVSFVSEGEVSNL